MSDRPTILLVDARPDRRRVHRAVLASGGDEVACATTLATVHAVLEGDRLAVLVAAADLDELNDVVAAIRDRDPLTQLVLVGPEAGHEPPRAMMRRLGAVGWHEPAGGRDGLLLTVEGALRAHAQSVELQLAERLKTELLANVSHELRTPLNVILGYLDLVREGTFGACPDEAGVVLDKARGNASWLLDLVEEFLDLSQLEIGTARCRRDPIDPAPVLRELADAFAVLVRDREIRFLVDLPDLPAVAADPAKLRVIVQNLLANAAKFTERGAIRLVAAADHTGALRVEVADTGPGIPSEHHEAVFDPFRQLAASEGTRRGIGLGLALARRFARMMGGELTLTSEVGRGSTFTLTLPPVCRPAARPKAA